VQNEKLAALESLKVSGEQGGLAGSEARMLNKQATVTQTRAQLDR
jgi:hypothetical protein